MRDDSADQLCVNLLVTTPLNFKPKTIYLINFDHKEVCIVRMAFETALDHNVNT